MTTPALQGIRVADFSHVFAGPFCTMTLGDMGAEILKIESPAGDAARAYPPHLHGESPSFLSLNRNKRGLVLNLGTDAGRACALEIIERSDVLVENFATGVMARLGLDYPSISRINPRLVYCSISAYGRTGKFSNRAGYDYVIQAETGMMSLNGHPDGEPHKTPIPFVDLASGMLAVQAILAALYARHSSGHGQHIDVPLFDSAVNLSAFQIMNYLASGENPVRMGNHSPIVAPVDLFAASDGVFFMNIAGDRVWTKLVGVLGNDPALLADDYATNAARVRNETSLKPILQRLFARQTVAYWIETLRAAGVPAGPVRSIAEAVHSPEMIERQLIGEAPHTAAGTVPNIRLPLSMSGTPLVPARGAPLLGEHTMEVLENLLGYSRARVSELSAAGAIGCAQPTKTTSRPDGDPGDRSGDIETR